MKSLTCVAIAALFSLTACGDDSTSANKQATVTLQLADAPGDLAHAWVEILEVSLQGTGANFVLVDASTGLVDLLTLATTTRELVADVPIPSGTYQQMRIVIGSGVIESNTGEVFTLTDGVHPGGMMATGQMHCPSCAQSGIKINLPDGGLRLDDEAVILVLDFDVSRSFGKERGNSGRWVMSPKMTATEVGASGSLHGTVALADGVVLPFCGDATRSLTDFVPVITAVDDTTQVKSGAVEVDGTYRIRFVAPGDYTVGFASGIEFGIDTLAFGDVTRSSSLATVRSGGTTAIDYTIHAVGCTP